MQLGCQQHDAVDRHHIGWLGNWERLDAAGKTGTTNDFRDVSGFGYIPGNLVTGVWMGNNNQEPMSNGLGQGLFSADGPLYLWQEFMTRALNEPWDWNGQQPVGQTSFGLPRRTPRCGGRRRRPWRSARPRPPAAGGPGG